MFKRILVPLDGSGRAERALPIAARLARASGGSILLVRVVSTEPASLPSAPVKPILIQTVGEADQALAESYLAGLARSDLLTGIPVRTHVPVGLVSPSILSVAADTYTDVIVMCSHGYTGVRRWWMIGSVAAKVARFGQIRVLVLREGGSVPLDGWLGLCQSSDRASGLSSGSPGGFLDREACISPMLSSLPMMLKYQSEQLAQRLAALKPPKRVKTWPASI